MGDSGDGTDKQVSRGAGLEKKTCKERPIQRNSNRRRDYGEEHVVYMSVSVLCNQRC